MMTVTREFADRVAEVAQLMEADEADEIGDETLRRLTALAAELVPGSTAAAVLVAMPGSGLTFAASDHRLEELHRLQFDSDDGPVSETLRHNEPRRVDDTSAERRWPAFCQAAAKAGSPAAWCCRCAPIGSRPAPSLCMVLSRAYSSAPRTTWPCSSPRRAAPPCTMRRCSVPAAGCWTTCTRGSNPGPSSSRLRASCTPSSECRPKRASACSAATPRTPTSGSGGSPPDSSRDG